MNEDNNKRILVIGATSKIAEQFIRSCPESYEVYGTFNIRHSDLVRADYQFQLDLGDAEQIKAFLHRLADVTLDAVLFFAATYTPDSDKADDQVAAYQKDLQLNAIHLASSMPSSLSATCCIRSGYASC